MTAAWAGTVCSDPVMVSVSIRKSRFTHELISSAGEFVISLTTEQMAKAVDYVGVKSGRDIDKFALTKDLKLTASPSLHIASPGIAESPVCLECKVEQVLELGSHDMFIARVLSTDIDEKYLDENGRFDLAAAKLLTYSHGEYYGLGRYLGKFGFSVQKKKTVPGDGSKNKRSNKRKEVKRNEKRNETRTGKADRKQMKKQDEK